MAGFHHKKCCTVFGFGLLLALVFVVGVHSRNDLSQDQYLSNDTFLQEPNFSKNHITSINGKLLASLVDDCRDGDGSLGGDDDRSDQISMECSNDNIYISQGPTSPLPDGIPTYIVQIQNVCVSKRCRIFDIHLSCGWFSSARLINPKVFRRISYNDCLVNNGNPISPGETISFQYANTFPYPMSVSSMSCN